MSDRSTSAGAIGSTRDAAGRTLLDDLVCPVLEITPAGRLRFANRAAAEALGLTVDDLDMPLLDRLGVSLEGQLRIGRRVGLLLAARAPAVRIWLERQPEVERPRTWQLSCRRDGRGRLVGIIAIAGPLPSWQGGRNGHAAPERPPGLVALREPDRFCRADARDRFSQLGEAPEACTSSAVATAPPSAARHVRQAVDRSAARPSHDHTGKPAVDGGRQLIRSSDRPVLDAADQLAGYLGVGRGIVAAAHAVERVRYLVRHDPLTGVVNRQALGETLSSALDEARQGGGGVALFALDLADFKRVNDSYGHGIGDQLLQEAAARLRRSVARSDTVARLGGDEFAVVVPLPEPDAAIAARIAERIAERLRQPFGIDGHEIHCGVCIGITLSPLHGQDVPTLLQQADLALHDAKRHDKGICVFGVELSAASQRRKSIEDALRRALARDEMSLVLQPQVAVGTKALVGCEALLRWRHGEPDEIGPAAFVPIAEETGLIVAFGSWVLNEACRLAAGWWQGGTGPRIAVNLSPVQFWNRDLCREVRLALAAAGLPPEALELEITEGVLMRDTRSAADTLKKLSELGVAIALDDFGTGYSSLSYLKKFPIHRLKIDRTFIRDLDHDDDDRQIAKAIIGLGHSLNLEVVAEGVETGRHLAFLEELGCDVAQGYFFSPPLTVPAFKAALQGHAWPVAGVADTHHRRSIPAERSPRRQVLRQA